MRPPRPTLQAARRARGWSQAEAARELGALARAAGGPAASPASLKSLLSRWENGHALPDPHYQALLGELYERTTAELGLAPDEPAPADGAARLRARLAAAAAVDDVVLDAWADQLALGRRLDDEVGAAGAAGIVRALVEELDRGFVHVVDPGLRTAVAAVLVPAATLAGWQELDRGDPERAWGDFDHARTVAAAVGAGAAAEATAGIAATLVDLGDPETALEVLDHAHPTDDGARAWIEAARGATLAARGHVARARGSFAASERAAVRDGGPASRPTPTAPAPPSAAAATPGAADGSLAGGLSAPEVRRRRAVSLARLGEPDAASALEAALAAGVRSARERAVTHAALAVALGPAVPSAAEHARAARAIAERIGSARAIGVLTAGRA